MSTDTPDPSSKSTPTEMTTENGSDMPQTETPGREKRGPNGSLIRSSRNKASLDRFEESVGGRGNLIDTLAMSSLDKKQEFLLRLLCDPQRQRDSLVTIIRDSGLRPIDVLDLFRNASFAKAHALAMGRLSEKLPEVVDDMVDKAIDAKVECPQCFGEGFIDEGVKCPICTGKGLIFRQSDIDRQKIVFETTGLTKKQGGVNVNVNQQVAVTQPGNFFSKYVKASDDVAYDVSELAPIEAEVKDAE